VPGANWRHPEGPGSSIKGREQHPVIHLAYDKAGKPVGIDLHIGKRPVFTAGNVRSGGDIAMFTYSQQQQPSFQLLINHDDAQREFAYQEPDNASLNAARTNGWQVVSMKKDWQTVFAFQRKLANENF
jgi:hypothetical protein